MAASSAAPKDPPAFPYAVTLATSFGFLLVQLDVSIVNVALAAIGDGLQIGMSGLQWVVDAYSLTFAAFLLLAGSLSDRIGARRVFIAGFALFMAASLGCGVAPTIGVMITARLVQGLAAALMVPSSLALLNHACGSEAAVRHRAVGLWTAAGSVGLALGPVAGGLLIGTIGWRAIFLVNLPVGVAGLWLTLRRVPDVRGGQGHFDHAGQILGIIGLFAMAGAAIEAGQQGWTSEVGLGGLGLAVMALTAFLFVENRASHPMLPLGFFRNSAFSAALAIGAVINFTVYGTLFLTSLLLQHEWSFGAVETGWVFLPCTAVVGAANVWAGSAARYHGTRRLMALGLLVGAAGFATLAIGAPNGSVALVILGLVLMGAGIGTAVPAMTSTLLGTVPKARGGVASGVLNTVRQAAGALGVAVFGALITGNAAHGAEVAMVVAVLLSLAALAACLTMGREPET